MEKENWIEEVLNSTNGMAQAQPNASLFSKIQSKIAEQEIVSPTWIWLAAASIAILFLLNARVIFSKSEKSKMQTESVAATLSASNQLY